MDDDEKAMNIFTLEYVVLAITLLIVVFQVTKRLKKNNMSVKSSVDDGKCKQLH